MAENRETKRCGPQLILHRFLSIPWTIEVECQFALEPSIQGLIEKAEDAGWNRQQAALAIVALASEHLSDLLPGLTVPDQRPLS
ncbi:hypothetical protein [Rhizobium sp. AN63]|uniref:hypothetical protein n=1 Tax=Rhizobium sp. AN63 TaxID=3035210 RepID=UPI0035A09065